MDTHILFEDSQFYYNYSINSAQETSPVEFPLHWHTFGEIILATKEHVQISVQGKEYCLKEGDIIFIWPGELHSILHAEPAGQLIIQYFSSLLSAFPDMALLQNRVLSIHHVSANTPNSPAAEMAGHMTMIRDTFHSQRPLNDMRMRLSLYHIFLALYDYCTEPSQSIFSEEQPVRLQTLQTISKACCYITQNCEKDLSLDEVANHVGISRFHFSRCFKEYTRTSFSDFLALQRIQKAISLFEDPDISISEAAFQSGFGSIASFNRSFKKYKGCTPSDYRNLMQQP